MIPRVSRAFLVLTLGVGEHFQNRRLWKRRRICVFVLGRALVSGVWLRGAVLAECGFKENCSEDWYVNFRVEIHHFDVFFSYRYSIHVADEAC